MSAVYAQEGWQAELRLRFARRGARTYLAERRHTGPLMIQRPFHPERNACHAYIVHPPGGIVGGDELRLQVAVEQGAHVLLTTPAATKFYRSAGSLARQTQVLSVEGGTLEWLPQETIFYRDARVRSSTQVHLNAGGKFIGWEIPCFGLPARNEAFDSGDLRLHFELWSENAPLLIDRMRIEGDSIARTAAWGLAGHTSVGTLLAYPANREMLDLARCLSVSDPLPRSTGEGGGAAEPQFMLNALPQFTATLVDNVLVCRCVSNQAEHIRKVFIKMWQALRPPLLNCPAVLPRIWAT